MKLEFLSANQAKEKKLHVYQKYAYSRYALPGTVPEIEIQQAHDNSIVRYITLWSNKPISRRDLNPESPHKKYSKELEEFSKLLGFMSLEIGSTTEANIITTKKQWPFIHTYAGDLAIHGNLSKEQRIEIQKELWKVAFSVVGIIPIFILTIDQVLEFAKTTGHIFELEADAELSKESNLVQENFSKWPGYWNKNPKLYRVNQGNIKK